jgi:hypothetical protein
VGARGLEDGEQVRALARFVAPCLTEATVKLEKRETNDDTGCR